MRCYFCHPLRRFCHPLWWILYILSEQTMTPRSSFVAFDALERMTRLSSFDIFMLLLNFLVDANLANGIFGGQLTAAEPIDINRVAARASRRSGQSLMIGGQVLRTIGERVEIFPLQHKGWGVIRRVRVQRRFEISCTVVCCWMAATFSSSRSVCRPDFRVIATGSCAICGAFACTDSGPGAPGKGIRSIIRGHRCFCPRQSAESDGGFENNGSTSIENLAAQRCCLIPGSRRSQKKNRKAKKTSQ